ncbi:MAG: amidohydrolase family protein [Raoultibacter sp.]
MVKAVFGQKDSNVSTVFAAGALVWVDEIKRANSLRQVSSIYAKEDVMPIIDIHAHIYPEKIASKAVDSVGDFYDIEMFGEGSAEALLEAAKSSPITNFVVHSVAMKPSVVESINDFIAEECRIHPEFIGFAAMHQDYPDPEAEIERAIGLGLRGIKLHPDTQEVNMDDPRLMRIYEIIEGRLPLIVHTGDYRYDYSHPRRLQSILHTFPHLVVDAAHFGGWSIQDEAIAYMENENCFLDVSSSMDFIGDEHTRKLVDTYGVDRILFGADFPMWNPTTELERFCALGFSDADLEKMLWRNAERFLGMKF